MSKCVGKLTAPLPFSGSCVELIGGVELDADTEDGFRDGVGFDDGVSEVVLRERETGERDGERMAKEAVGTSDVEVSQVLLGGRVRIFPSSSSSLMKKMMGRGHSDPRVDSTVMLLLMLVVRIRG